MLNSNIQRGNYSLFLGFHDEIMEFLKRNNLPRYFTAPFASLLENHIRRDADFYIDDFELNSGKWAKTFPNQKTLMDALKSFSSTGTAYIFTTEAPTHKTLQDETSDTDVAADAKRVMDHLHNMLKCNDLSSREIEEKVSKLSEQQSSEFMREAVKYLLNRQREAYAVQHIYSIDISGPEITDSHRRQVEDLLAK